MGRVCMEAVDAWVASLPVERETQIPEPAPPERNARAPARSEQRATSELPDRLSQSLARHPERRRRFLAQISALQDASAKLRTAFALERNCPAQRIEVALKRSGVPVKVGPTVE